MLQVLFYEKFGVWTGPKQQKSRLPSFAWKTRKTNACSVRLKQMNLLSLLKHAFSINASDDAHTNIVLKPIALPTWTSANAFFRIKVAV